jgi:2-iminobutanoate/2-iminopropanoate deaminase
MSPIQTIRGQGNKGPYSQSVICGGLVFTAGQVPVIPETGTMIQGSIAEEATQVLTNLQRVLTEAGSSLSRVLKVTVYLADMEDFGQFNQVYQQFFVEHLPARTCIQAGKLPFGVKVEVEAVAAL